MSTYGPDYDEKKDKERLSKQRDDILKYMLENGWRTLFEIEDVLKYPQASISAQLRHLRKPQHGSFIVDKRRRGPGTWEYYVREPKKIERESVLKVPFPDKKYKTIYADPPWWERGCGRIKRGADRHYTLMKTRDIMALPIQTIAGPNCHLYLWVTNNFLKDGLEVMEAWGFKYKTMITWVKDRMGLGQYFRGITEHCLFGVKGKVPFKTVHDSRQQGVTVIDSPRLPHSEKPPEMRGMIEKVSYPPFIELFARQSAPNWDSWGNEIIMNSKGEMEEGKNVILPSLFEESI